MVILNLFLFFQRMLSILDAQIVFAQYKSLYRSRLHTFVYISQKKCLGHISLTSIMIAKVIFNPNGVS